MRFKTCLYLFLVLMGFIIITISVPHEFCLEEFDWGDCGEAPTPVFYYYKSGSRCELQIWRGCPTLNKFPDEFLCSHYCIGSLLGSINGEDSDEFPIDSGKKGEWVEHLNVLKVSDIETIDKILESLEAEPVIEKLSKVKRCKPKPTCPPIEYYAPSFAMP